MNKMAQVRIYSHEEQHYLSAHEIEKLLSLVLLSNEYSAEVKE